MVFNDDATLMSLFNIYEDESELKDAVLKYVRNGSVGEVVERTQSTEVDDEFLKEVRN